MKYLSIFKYVYLVFGVLFAYRVIEDYQVTSKVNYAYLLLAATSIFMFFFRNRFNKKFQDRNNDK